MNRHVVYSLVGASALVLMSTVSSAQAFEMLGRMFHGHGQVGGCGCAVEPGCGVAEPSCGAPAECGCEPCCCKPRRCKLGLCSLFHRKPRCCAPSCCEPACEPSCSEPACEPSCCEPCCKPKRKCCGWLKRLFHHHRRCDSCCTVDCGCEAPVESGCDG